MFYARAQLEHLDQEPVFLLLSQEPLGVDTLFGEKVFELNLGVGHFAMGRIPHSQRMQVL